MKRKALMVGINYPGTNHALRGCVTDVNTVNDLISSNYEFKNSNDRHILTDRSATTQNILEELEWLVADSQPGDVLFFHYSGHGSQVPDDNGDEIDGLDEILCPIDLDWRTKIIRDDELCRIFNKVPKGVNATVILDCCHSGDGIDSINSYQPNIANFVTRDTKPFINRYLPMPNELLMEHLTTRSWNFQSNSIPKVKNESALLISGCRSNQTSADAFINNNWRGAATFFLKRTLISNNHDITYKLLAERMNIHLANAGYTQRPELNGKSDLFNHKFLQPFI